MNNRNFKEGQFTVRNVLLVMTGAEGQVQSQMPE